MQKLVSSFIVGSICLLLNACAAQPPSAYDLVQDRSTSKLYVSIADFFITYPVGQVGSCEFEQFTGFYHDAMLSSFSLHLRAGAMPANGPSAAQFGLLVDSVERLQGMHQAGCLSQVVVDDMQASFDSLFGSILRLELEKKYGG
jgi:hypothetical protein